MEQKESNQTKNNVIYLEISTNAIVCATLEICLSHLGKPLGISLDWLEGKRTLNDKNWGL